MFSPAILGLVVFTAFTSSNHQPQHIAVKLDIERRASWSPRTEVTSATATIIGERDSKKGATILYLLTSAHAIPNLLSHGQVTAHFASSSTGALGPTARAHLLCRHSRRDLAVLWLEAPHGSRFDVARSAPLHQRDQIVTAVGFTAGSRLLARADGRVIGSHQRLRREIRATATGPALGELDLGPAVVHTAPIDPGMSGGPLLDASGRVVGIHVGRLTPSASLPRGRSISSFVAELVPEVPERLQTLCRDSRRARTIDLPTRVNPSELFTESDGGQRSK